MDLIFKRQREKSGTHAYRLSSSFQRFSSQSITRKQLSPFLPPTSYFHYRGLYRDISRSTGQRLGDQKPTTDTFRWGSLAQYKNHLGLFLRTRLSKIKAPNRGVTCGERGGGGESPGRQAKQTGHKAPQVLGNVLITSRNGKGGYITPLKPKLGSGPLSHTRRDPERAPCSSHASPGQAPHCERVLCPRPDREGTSTGAWGNASSRQ